MICPDYIPLHSPKSPFLLSFKWEKLGGCPGGSENGEPPQNHPNSVIFAVGKLMVLGYHNFKKPPNGKTWKSCKKGWSLVWYLVDEITRFFRWFGRIPWKSHFFVETHPQTRRRHHRGTGARTCAAEPLQNGSIRCRCLEASRNHYHREIPQKCIATLYYILYVFSTSLPYIYIFQRRTYI